MWIFVPVASSPSAPGSAASTSDLKWRSQMLASSAALSGKPTRPSSLLRAWKRVPWIQRLFGRISEPSKAQTGVDAWMASLEVSRARPSRKPETASESMTSDGSGLGSPDFFAKVERGGVFLRMYAGCCQLMLDGSSEKWSGAWPTSGSMRSGLLSRRPTSVPATSESESSSWPTATAMDAHGSRDTSHKPGSKRHKGTTLTDATLNLWPTPRTITGGGESAERKQELGREDAGGGDLQAAAELWQTPATDSFRSRGGDRKGEMGLDQEARSFNVTPAEKTEPYSSTMDSRIVPSAEGNWPTPNSRDHKGSDLSTRNGGASLSHFAETGERTHGTSPSSPQVQVISVHGGELSPTDPSTALRRRLNPAFVCWLMGWPWWWTNPGVINSARQETESYLSRLRTLLSSLLGEQDSSR
jgi:hypothetical protein